MCLHQEKRTVHEHEHVHEHDLPTRYAQVSDKRSNMIQGIKGRENYKKSGSIDID